MKINSLALCAILLVLLQVTACSELKAPVGRARSADAAPHLQKNGQVTQLMVDGKPWLALAGELHNSSASSLEYMESIWWRLKAMNLNTVLAVVSWEQFEPKEGVYDFSIVDGLLQQARDSNLRLVLLWFGSWKNSTSRYAADYVKADSQRFPRVINKAGKPLEILSALSDNTLKADTAAYVAMMKHLKQVDQQHTVLMIQMQNEVGVLGDSRDRSPAANAAFEAQVPAALMSYLQQHRDTLRPEIRKLWDAAGNKTAGTWAQVFGSSAAADEVFQAWQYATFCNHMTEAGKQAYDLPVFVNAWIVQPEDKGPGDYPSGGPQAHVHDIWLAGAPSIDILAPDIYLPDFRGVVKMYEEPGKAMFIPESRASVANAYYAIGEGNSIGYSPFGIDGPRTDPNGPLAAGYAILQQLAPMILKAQSEGKIGAVWLDRQHSSGKVTLGDYTVNIRLRTTRGQPDLLPESGYAMVIQNDKDEFTVSGSDVEITFSANGGAGSSMVGLLKVEEMTVVAESKTPSSFGFSSPAKPPQLMTLRRLNGDEVQLRYELSEAAADNQSGAGLRFGAGAPGVQHVWLYRY